MTTNDPNKERRIESRICFTFSSGDGQSHQLGIFHVPTNVASKPIVSVGVLDQRRVTLKRSGLNSVSYKNGTFEFVAKQSFWNSKWTLVCDGKTFARKADIFKPISVAEFLELPLGPDNELAPSPPTSEVRGIMTREQGTAHALMQSTAASQGPQINGGKKAMAIIVSILVGLIGNGVIMVLAGGFLAKLPLLIRGGLGGLCFFGLVAGTYQALARALSRKS